MASISSSVDEKIARYEAFVLVFVAVSMVTGTLAFGGIKLLLVAIFACLALLSLVRLVEAA